MVTGNDSKWLWRVVTRFIATWVKICMRLIAWCCKISVVSQGAPVFSAPEQRHADACRSQLDCIQALVNSMMVTGCQSEPSVFAFLAFPGNHFKSFQFMSVTQQRMHTQWQQLHRHLKPVQPLELLPPLPPLRPRPGIHTSSKSMSRYDGNLNQWGEKQKVGLVPRVLPTYPTLSSHPSLGFCLLFWSRLLIVVLILIIVINGSLGLRLGLCFWGLGLIPCGRL